MSNQEAIVLLRNLEDALDSYCELNEEGKTAFRMAIEALQGKDTNVPANDCISRQAAIDALDGELDITGRKNAETIRDYINGVDKKLRELPSAERRGRWEEVQRLSPAEHQAICKCSVCGNTVWAYFGERRWHYCPNCGSRMDLDEVTE